MLEIKKEDMYRTKLIYKRFRKEYFSYYFENLSKIHVILNSKILGIALVFFVIGFAFFDYFYFENTSLLSAYEIFRLIIIAAGIF